MHARILPPTSVGGTCILADVGIKSIPGSIIVLESESAFFATHLDHRSLPSLADGHHTRRSHRIAGVPYSHTEYSVLVGRSTRLMWLFGIPWSLLVSCSNVWRYIAQDTAAFIISCLPPNKVVFVAELLMLPDGRSESAWLPTGYQVGTILKRQGNLFSFSYTHFVKFDE